MQTRKTIPIHEAIDDEAASACSGAEPYALMVLGDSMLPEFENGDIIVVEPEGLAQDGSFVVAYHKDEYTFRQLLIRDEKWYLSALNDLYPTEQISGPEAVKGVVIQKKKPGRRSSMKSYI